MIFYINEQILTFHILSKKSENVPKDFPSFNSSPQFVETNTFNTNCINTIQLTNFDIQSLHVESCNHEPIQSSNQVNIRSHSAFDNMFI